jgi:hypothetical protein
MHEWSRTARLKPDVSPIAIGRAWVNEVGILLMTAEFGTNIRHLHASLMLSSRVMA